MAKEYPSMEAATNDQAYDTVSQIWTLDGKMTEEQAVKLGLFAERGRAGRKRSNRVEQALAKLKK